jgi:hypothetical protein
MRRTTLISGLMAVTAATVSAPSSAETSANIGWVSEYIFRGVFQEDSSAYAGIDYAHDSGFYLGAWGADVGRGNEIDYYFGYAGGDDDFTWKVGYTAYTYTDDFDDTYQEVNLGIGYGIFALDVAIGEWDGFGTSRDYDFSSITISPEKGPYYKIGMWGDDYEDLVLFPNVKTPGAGDGDYFEIGYAYTIEESAVDLSIALIYSDDLVVGDWDDALTGEPGSDSALVFGVKKSIAIGD